MNNSCLVVTLQAVGHKANSLLENNALLTWLNNPLCLEGIYNLSKGDNDEYH